MKEKIQFKIQKLERFYDRISSAELLTDVAADGSYSLTLLLKLEPKKELCVQIQDEDWATALDKTLAKMEKQLKKFKEKLTETRPE